MSFQEIRIRKWEGIWDVPGREAGSWFGEFAEIAEAVLRHRA